jgi:hypothetical protein
MSVVEMYWVPHLKPMLRQLHGTDSLPEVQKRFCDLLSRDFDPVSQVSPPPQRLLSVVLVNDCSAPSVHVQS